MENKAEDSLKEIAAKAGTTVKNIYALTVQAFINEQKIQDHMNILRQTEIQHAQFDLTVLQIEKQKLENQYMTARLTKKLKPFNLLGTFKKIKP